MSSPTFHLKRDIGLFEAVLYGVGIILGAGIYALIGAGADVAGNALWMSFFAGAILAAFTGLSYAELSSMYPKDAAEYVYVKHAFNKKLPAFIVEWLMLFTGIVSATTVALGFSGYFSYLFGGNAQMIAAILIVLISLLNYYGIKESARYNDVSTLIEVAGLLFVIGIGAFWFFTGKSAEIDFFAAKDGVRGVLGGTAIIFFAFLGFEHLANMAEETKNAPQVIPRALLLSLFISTMIYILVSLAAIAVLPAKELAASPAPLAAVVKTALPWAEPLLSVIALFATSNTVLIILIVASRLLYGLSFNHSLPSPFKKIGWRGTPTLAVVTVGALAIAGLFIGNIKQVALLTDVGIFLVYIAINLAAFVLRYHAPETPRPYRAPFNFGRFSVTAFLGFLSAFGMLFFFETKLLIYELLVLLAGLVLYWIFKKRAVSSVG